MSVVLFGATGYTGRLTASALLERGARPVLAGRSHGRLEALAEDVDADLPLHVADADEPATLAAAVAESDVLVTTVGPFMQRGAAALDVAVQQGAHYLDSTGEPPFIRRVFQVAGPKARGRSTLLTAFGYDYVPGNLAGAIALREAGVEAVSIDIGYFATGPARRDSVSSGTLASIVGMLETEHHAFRGGRLMLERPGRRSRAFEVGGRHRRGLSVGGSEHLALPAEAPQLRQVDVELGWFGPFSGALQAGAAGLAALRRLPLVDRGIGALSRRLAGRTGDGPSEQTRAMTGSHVVAVAHDRDGGLLADVHLEGPNAYTLTARLLAWAAVELAGTGSVTTGGVGPVAAFGLDRLRDGCRELGLVRTR